MDFEKVTVTVEDSEMKMKVNACKKYDTDHGWVVVVYVELVNGAIRLNWFGRSTANTCDTSAT